MSAEIHNQLLGPTAASFNHLPEHHSSFDRPKKILPTLPKKVDVPLPNENLKVLHQDIQEIVAELRQVSHAVNRRLDFEMNNDLGQVVVRIVNSDTGEVIKVLPPEELQRLHMKIQETVGLLIDEKI